MLNFLLRLNALGGYAAGALLWALMFIVTADVAVRNLGSSLLWVNEVSGYLLVAIVFLGAGYTYDRDGHFAITLMVAKLPRAPRLALELAMVLLSLTFCLMLAWGGIELVRFAQSLALTAPTLLQTPLYLPYAAIVIGAASLSISLVLRAVSLASALRRHKDIATRAEHSI